MLTADLVRARPRGRELKIVRLKGKSRLRARQFAESYLSIAQSYLGATRGEFNQACESIVSNPRERKLVLGLKKIVEDLSSFEADESIDSRELRRQVFERATVLRSQLGPGEPFESAAVLQEIAKERGADESPEQLRKWLYSDLREANVLTSAPVLTAEALVDAYETAQSQAVLLRATHVTVDIYCSNQATYRYLFSKLKFRRLLYKIRENRSGYTIEISGPHSLFSSVKKYGLQLALMLPVFQLCNRWSLKANILWGKEGRPLTFSLTGVAPKSHTNIANDQDHLPEEAKTLIVQFEKLSKASGWEVRPSEKILDLPGLGLCVPDLEFTHQMSKTVVFLEVMGFWSRDAVWNRVDLVRAGLDHKIIFAVPKRLRVSEEVLDDDLPGEIYVYKGKLNPKLILSRLDQMI